MSAESTADDMFAPPINRAMKVLDRSFFQKTVPASAARIFNPKDIATCRTALIQSHDALANNRIHPIRADPEESRAQKGGKCILLRPEVLHNGMTDHPFDIEEC
jgi:tRNA (guanine37-N1)-methyltransferase